MGWVLKKIIPHINFPHLEGSLFPRFRYFQFFSVDSQQSSKSVFGMSMFGSVSEFRGEEFGSSFDGWLMDGGSGSCPWA